MGKSQRQVTMRLFILAAMALAMSVSAVAYSKDVGVFGTVYEIAEPDIKQEMVEKSRTVDTKKVLADARKNLSKYRPPDIVSLPRAKEGKKFQVDMTYTLEFDIPDDQGVVIYPKGYTFNPLDFVRLDEPIIVFNAEDRDQMEWYKRHWQNKISVIILLTEGSLIESRKKMKREVYYASERIVRKFKLKAVPSVVRQMGRQIEVEEVDVNGKKPKKG